MRLPADLRLRIVVAVGIVLLQSPITHIAPSTTYLGWMIALAALSKTPISWRRLLHLEAFLILLFITLPFTIPGTPIFQIGGIEASWQGFERAIVLAFKISASVLLLMVCFSRIEPVKVGQALRGLKVPEALVRILLGLIRYLDTIGNEFRRLQDAMRLRSFRPGSNRHTWKTYGNMIGMLLLRSLARADRVEEAMRMRSFAGHFPTMPLPAIAFADWLLSALLLALATALLNWEILWIH
ncbi:cobalt ECF transporter T component CbiQ [uncultured Cohaesibacter sp.]|uniref:cobalt ECF transporter T component CbiQ n=1 Tax=uncultured Cohaesibacter sp. TaxID=1002546 RepID=UPI0029C9667F|nr:cobalt ECF transporter T component CbiQ [uncultured Cohaesibacter sp.]